MRDVGNRGTGDRLYLTGRSFAQSARTDSSQERGRVAMPIENVASAESRQVADSGWWAVYTRHQHERVVAEMIVAKGLEVFFPTYRALRHWKDRNATIAMPLFPCYLFVREGPARRLQVLTTPGVNLIVTLGGRLAVIGDAEIGALRRAVEGPREVRPHSYLRCGERVRVAHGPMRGVEGILVRKKNLCRLVLSVDMLARSASVEVNAWDVIPAPMQHAFAGVECVAGRVASAGVARNRLSPSA